MRPPGPWSPPGKEVVLFCGKCLSLPVTAFRLGFGWDSSRSPGEHGLPAHFIYVQVPRVPLAETVGRAKPVSEK